MKVNIGTYPTHRFYHNWLYSWFGYSPQQTIKVKIDKWDTWSMDHTLAHIILPMLVQLKATNHGYPGSLTEAKWHEIQDKMIWAFEQKCRDNWQDDFYGDYIEDPKNGSMAGSFEWIDHDGMKAHQTRMTNGFKLFGKYYENLWD
mgnify:CR=1 FL=1|tara:strand:- start:2163 stop:2597 length:435 start_codon:yes stop_codon:yes gene_type:complete